MAERKKCQCSLCPGKGQRDAEFVLTNPLGHDLIYRCRACSMWSFDQMLSQAKSDTGGKVGVIVASIETAEKIEEAMDAVLVEIKRRGHGNGGH